MKKAMITTATVFALVVSAGMSMAGPLRGDAQRGFAQDVRSSVSQARVSGALTELTTSAQPFTWVQTAGECISNSVGDRNVTTYSDDQRYDQDFLLGEVAGGQLFGGLELGISSLTSGASSRLANANISADSYDATLSALWVAESQFYIDGQFRYGDFDSRIDLNGRNTLDINGSGYQISVELGKSFALQNEWTLIPQVQVMYSDIDLGDAAGRIGSLVDDDALTARIGLRAARTFANNSMLYGQIDFYNTFDTETSAAIDQNTAALSVGGIVALSDRSQLYAEITTETELGSGSGGLAFGWDIGFEVRF
ncbi:autotransporter outer membrane beta-barrel domain-containing protein [Roseovarius sp. EL26]|uniref:autotransporter domain-containing protein n=1 Tax=Roseovarius sp. EL26 TaxID=2126672 RepID=UPI000EA1FB71|nr:autotransporter outer membrane beta-barrel domain-containing protein [Roseovarius sp. EL26]